jgi:tetratricopeptide (TPR) repeat protein
MKTLFFLSSLSLAALLFTSAPAQAQAVKDVPQPAQAGQLPAPLPPGPPLDPAKVAEYQKRFEQGYELQKAGKLQEARTVYDGILAEQPDAKRSLLEAGRISLKLDQPDKADEYLSRLHAIVPDFPEAIELLIQANQALKRDIKVSNLIKQFQTLHSTTQDAAFAQSPNFVRETVKVDANNTILFTQFFDYTKNPNYVWQAQLLGADGAVKRQLNLFYDAKAGSDIEAKDPKLANAAQFILVEDIVTAGKVSRVDAYFQMFTLPEYKKIRNTMLAIFSGAYKPVYSQQIGPAATTPAPQ